MLTNAKFSYVVQCLTISFPRVLKVMFIVTCSTGFPGCHPVSMDTKNIAKLRKPYMVSWKADGTR